MIKQGLVKEELSVDSYARKGNGSCPLMPEEVLPSLITVYPLVANKPQSTLY